MDNGKPETKTVNIGMVLRPVPPVREFFDEEELGRLAQSIRENGILVPLMVRPKDDKYEVIDGDRRLAAAWKADLREIPVMVYTLSDEQTHIQRMLANLDRHDPDPVSEAKYIARVISDGLMTAQEFAEKLGRSMDWIESRLTIAEMPEYMQLILATQKMPLGVCLELNQINDEGTKQRYFEDALRNGSTIHAARVNRQMVNEAIEANESAGVQSTEETVPEPQRVPQARCAYTGEMMYITEMRMVRVGIKNHEDWQTELRSKPSPIDDVTT